MTKEFLKQRIADQKAYIYGLNSMYHTVRTEVRTSANHQLIYFENQLKQLNTMNYKKYQEEAARTFANRKEPLDTDITDELHCVIGMSTEVAELMDAFKKRIYYLKPFDETNSKEELGDLMWYIANYCRLKGYDLEDIMEMNINKLRIRYPEKFSLEQAENRDLEAERKSLESNN